MNQEFSALIHNGTWSLVSPPTHANIVGCRWIYKIKRKADGAIERYKAHLVAKGFHQREGVDFSETFNPVIKHAPIRLVISIAVTYKWPIKQLDVQNAFLHENMFMLQPQGYVHPQYPNHVCKLHKSLYFLGVEALWCTDGMYLTQCKYIADLLRRSKMENAKPCISPMASNCRLTSTDGTPFKDISLYHSIVGSMQYLAFTRLDLAFVVHKVSKFMHNPLDTYWQAVKLILRYLKHSISTGLFITSNVNFTLQAFSDSDWAADRDDRRSVGAYYIYMGSNLVSWSCKQQPIVARSSTEVEYKAIANAAAELIWFKSILRALGLPPQHSPTLWCDNIGAIYLTSNPKFHARTKHVEIDVHFVRDQVYNKELVVQFISSKDQLADALTKPLPPIKFKEDQHNLNVRDLPFRLRGRVEDQVMVTEFKGEDTDPPVNAVTETVKDHTKQSYEEQESDTPVITAAATYPP